MAKQRTESDLVRACLEYLAAHKIMAWRNNTGAMRGDYKGKQWFMRFGAKGSGDIFAILPGGRFLSIECKTAKGRISETQAAWELMVAKAGGVAMVVRDIETLNAMLRQIELEGGR